MGVGNVWVFSNILKWVVLFLDLNINIFWLLFIWIVCIFLFLVLVLNSKINICIIFLYFEDSLILFILVDRWMLYK